MSDSLKIGEMRYYLKAMSKTQTKSASGQINAAWNYAFSFWASADTLKAQESSSGLMPSVRTTVNFSTWIRDDITREMRIIYENDTYQIIGLFKGFKTMNIECERIEQ